VASPTTGQIRRLIRTEIQRIVRIHESDTIEVLAGDNPLQPEVKIDPGGGLTSSSGGLAISTAPAGGIVEGPTLTTDNAIALWDGATGDLLQNSGILVLDIGGAWSIRTSDAATPDAILIQPGIAATGDGPDLTLNGSHSTLGAGGDVLVKGGTQDPGASPGGGNIDLTATNARGGSGNAGGIVRLQGGTNDDGSGPAFVHVRTSDLKVDGDVYANDFFSTAAPMQFTAPSGQTIDSIVNATTVLSIAETLITANVDLDLSANSIVNVDQLNGLTVDNINNFWNGAIAETINIDVVADTAAVYLELEASGGGDLTCIFAGDEFILDCTPAQSVVLTEGSGGGQLNYVYITKDSGDVLTLEASTVGWPDEPHCPVATVMAQDAADVGIDGAMKVHAWTDHLSSTDGNGHLSHLNKKLRENAVWKSGVAPSDITAGQISTTAGVVFQLHEHTMPARDMSSSDGDATWVVNDNATPFKRVTDIDNGGIDSLSDGTAITNNRYVNLVLIGVVSEDEADCKLFWTLPSGDYTSSANAQADSDNTAVYSLGTDFTGTAFLIARYTTQYSTGGGGSHTQVLKTDLRGLQPSTSPGGGAITDHGNLSGLGDVDDHLLYLDLAGTRAMTGDLDMDSNDIDNARVVTAASFLSLLSAAGNNAITVTGGSNSGGTGSSVAISAGFSSGSDGDGGTVSLAAGGKHGTGTEGRVILYDHGGIEALIVTEDATPVVEITRSLNPMANVVLPSGDRIGPGSTTNLTFITDTSATLKVNNIDGLAVTDTLVTTISDVRIQGNALTVGDGSAIFEMLGTTVASGDVPNMEFVGADATSAGDGQGFRFHCGNAATVGSHDGGGFTIDLGALTVAGTMGGFLINDSAGSAVFSVTGAGVVSFAAGTNVTAAGILDMDGANIIDADNILVLDGGIIGSSANDGVVFNAGVDIVFTTNSVQALDITPTTLDGNGVLRLQNFKGMRETFVFGWNSANTSTTRFCYGPGAAIIGLAASREIQMLHPGSIVSIGLTVDVNVLGTGDTLEGRSYINSVAALVVSDTVIVANGQKSNNTAAVGTHTFVKGDSLDAARTLTGTSPGQVTTDDFTIVIEVEYSE